MRSGTVKKLVSELAILAAMIMIVAQVSQVSRQGFSLHRREVIMKPRFLSSTQRILMAVLFVLTFGALLSAQSTTDGAIGGAPLATHAGVVTIPYGDTSYANTPTDGRHSTPTTHCQPCV